jgi:hypothetical protein
VPRSPFPPSRTPLNAYKGNTYFSVLGTYFYPVITPSGRFQCAIHVTTIGSAAVIAFEVLNFGHSSISFSVGFTSSVSKSGSYDITWRDFGNRTGFSASSSSETISFLLGNVAVVTPPSTYWFQGSGDMRENVWSQGSAAEYTGGTGVALSSQSPVLQPYGKESLSFIARLGPGSTPPLLTLSETP